MATDAATVPVIVGVGQINDRPLDPAQGLDSTGLMEAALRAADADAGGGWLADLDSLSVVDQISFPGLGDMSAALAASLGAHPRICEKTAYPMGDSPILLLNQAANRIAAGDITIAAVAGGEALRTAARRASAATGTAASSHNATRAMSNRRAPGLRQRFGLVAPVDIYPLYENAGRAAYGQTLEQGQSESAQIWAGFSTIAAHTEAAWLRTPVTAAQIQTPSADNRPIAFPYLKLMVANSSVNQGAGFIVTSLAEARRRGVAEDRIVHIGHGAAAHEPDDFLARDSYVRSTSMEASLRHAMAMNNVTTEDLDFVELYSCFPCVSKMARRVLGWPVDRPATVFGGLTFGGGPIGNYMSHAVACMVDKLRQGGRRGLLFANGGYATHNHTILLSREPVDVCFPQDYDVQQVAEAARGPIPRLLESYEGDGTIETYTVFYERDGAARFGLVIGRTPDGDRFLAKVPPDDTASIAFLTDGRLEPVGTRGRAVRVGEEDAVWQRADG